MIDVVTLGCRLNSYESEVMRQHAQTAGLNHAVVINTCAVTAEAVRQARQTIRRLRRENPAIKIIVTGCAAQTEPDTFADMPEVDHVIGNHDKMQADTWKELSLPLNDFERVRVNDIMSVRETAAHLVAGFDGRARAFVQIQNGCDHRCTFCIIPYGRGPSRSVGMGAVVNDVRQLVDKGYREIVLTGVDITSYGSDLPRTPTLGVLVQKILETVPDLPRLRISSIDSIEADDALFDAFATDARLMPHVHLSVQAGDNLTLKRMKRRHLRDDTIDFCEKLRAVRPDVVFGADFIAGFPTETDHMFAKTVDLIHTCDLTYLHVFPFSPRAGTPAAKMPQVARAVVRERAQVLRDIGARQLQAHLASQQGLTRHVLVENETLGRTEHFASVKFSSPQKCGVVVQAPIVGFDAQALIAGSVVVGAA